MVVTITVDAKRAAQKIQKIAKETPQELKQAVAQLALYMEGEAKKNAPVDTVTLRASIDARKVTSTEWIVEDGVDYGVYMEYGTVKVRPKPFMRPAAEAGARFADRLINDALNKAFK